MTEKSAQEKKDVNWCAICQFNGANGVPMRCRGCIPGWKNYKERSS